MSIQIRSASVSDIPLIASLADRIWRAHYPGIISQEQIDYMLDLMYSEKSLQKQMEEGYQFFMVENNAVPLGYISIGKKAEGEYFLSKFYMEQTEQGKGYGKTAFDQLISRFPDMKTIRLQVNRRNFKSVNFYFKNGFVIEDAKDFDVGAGFTMDDFVMCWERK